MEQGTFTFTLRQFTIALVVAAEYSYATATTHNTFGKK